MKVGDYVAYVDGSPPYARWFLWQIGQVEGASDNGHVSVRWLTPVKYHDKFTEVSGFHSERFAVVEH